VAILESNDSNIFRLGNLLDSGERTSKSPAYQQTIVRPSGNRQQQSMLTGTLIPSQTHIISAPYR
jgi:hypothetical protein